MNPAPYTALHVTVLLWIWMDVLLYDFVVEFKLNGTLFVSQNSSLPRIFRLFRGLGLRHLVIVNDVNEVMPFTYGNVELVTIFKHCYFRSSGSLLEKM